MTTTTVTADDLLAEASWAQRLAQSLVGEDANDLVQDGYLAALEARPSSNRPIRPWLRRVLTNRAYNWTRARRREQARVRVVNHGTMPAGPSAEDLLARMEVQRTLSALVTALDEPYRQTVLLHFYEGLTSKQIEQLHGVPAGTVRWRLKEALDRLRRQLDEQHGGRRAAWRRLLVPLIPLPRPRGVGGGRIVLAAAVLIGVAGIFSLVSSRGRQANERVAGGLSAAGTAGLLPAGGEELPSGSGRSRLFAMAPTTLEGCRSRLGEVRAEVARIEPEYVQVGMPRTLFEGATPNPAAARALGPALTRLMKGEDGRPVDYTLECRGWVCRMLVLQSSGNPNAWQLPLQRDPELLERTRLRGFGSGRPTRDPASGTGLRERQVWLKLAALDGGRLPGSTMGRIPTRIWTEPANPAECQSALGAAQALLASMREVIARDTRLDQRFATATADPALTREFRNLVKAAVAGTPGIREPQVECRAGRVCRISAETEPGVPADVWWHRITRDPAIRPMVASGMFGREVYLRLYPPGTSDGLALLKRLVDDWQASSALAQCARAHSAVGELQIRFSVPETGTTNPHGETAKISADVGGALADSPLARCAVEAAEQLVLTVRLPEQVSSSTIYRKVRFPLEGKPADGSSRRVP